jgi:alpha-N-arabinofuranosidase
LGYSINKNNDDMINKFFFNVSVTLFLASGAIMAQKSTPIVVNADKPLSAIQPTMWGVFFEDINMAADGGIYAELVKNRSFEFFQPLMGWKELKQDSAAGSLLVSNRAESNPVNPRYAQIAFDNSKGTYGLTNFGFRGMGIKKDMKYHFSVMVNHKMGNVKLNLELIDAEGNKIGQATLVPGSDTWGKYTVDILATKTEPKAKLTIWFEGAGSLDIDMVSLFPDDTWKHRPNGLRSDLVQLLADMKPGFIRFPGGCIVEGRELATRYQWKKTVGNLEDRQSIVNRWNTEFSHRPTPDYFQTFGLGFYEYFQLAEDIGAQPLPILSCGMACQFNTAEVVPMDMLDPYIQDALDLIEFANGSTTSAWGKLRASMGHPEPFNLKMLGVGNEQWGPQYIERYKAFKDTLKKYHPEITLVTGTGPSPDGFLFNFAAGELKKLNAEIVDEHYYKNPQWFLENATRYDNYDRKSYKIFAGEYAAQSVATVSPLNKNNWNCALSEAAFMTGLERNADVVYMSSYAPLFAHTEGWQWTPDLIWFNNLTSFGTTNYYVQKLFSVNKGTNVLSMLKDNKTLTGQSGLFASAAFDKATGEIILKIVNASDKALIEPIVIQSARKLAPAGKMTVLESKNPDETNSIEKPENVAPQEKQINIKGKKLDLNLDPLSFTVIRIKTL